VVDAGLVGGSLGVVFFLSDGKKILRGHDTWQKNLCGHATWRFTATVCTQGGKIGNLEKVGGYLQEIFLQGVSQNTPTLQGVLAYLPLYEIK
jgi:hypothetical protein